MRPLAFTLLFFSSRVSPAHALVTLAFPSPQATLLLPASCRKRTSGSLHVNLSLSALSEGIKSLHVPAPPPLHVPSPSTCIPFLALVPSLLLLRPLNLTRPLLIASLRTVLQLSILGGVVLSVLFRHSAATVVLPYLGLLALVAAGEATSRVKYAYPKLRAHALLSLLVGCGSTLFLAAFSTIGGGGLCGIHAKKFDARTLVPLGGMLLGNAVTSIALVADSLVTSLTEQTDRIDLYLSKGATVREASVPIVKSAVATALAPTVNSLSVCGLVHIPGVMAGQILAGSDPRSAGRSQAMVMLLIAGASATSVLVMVALVMREAFDWDWQRVRDGWGGVVRSATTGGVGTGDGSRGGGAGWGKVWEGVRGAVRRRKGERSGAAAAGWGSGEETVLKASASTRHLVARSLSDDESVHPPLDQRPSVLRATSVPIPRTNYTVTFDLRQGDRLGITGKSGVGKTSLLRTLALLEGGCTRSSSANLTLRKEAAPGRHGAPDWRRRVSWVPQHRPTVPGTPGQFYDIVEGVEGRKRSRRRRLQYHDNDRGGEGDRTDLHSNHRHPAIVASDWNLDPSAFGRPWSTLSGGEASRAALALAIALRPDVLLLDEPTAGCDAETERRVEKTLVGESNRSGTTAAVIVTHSREQLERLCTHHLELN